MMRRSGVCLLAELVHDGLKDEDGTSGTDHSQWLSGEHVVRDAAYSTADEAFHCRLNAPITHAFTAWAQPGRLGSLQAGDKNITQPYSTNVMAAKKKTDKKAKQQKFMVF